MGTSRVEMSPCRRHPVVSNQLRAPAIGIGSSGSSHSGLSSADVSDQPSNNAPEENGSVGHG